MNIDALIENFYKKTENDNLVDEVMKYILSETQKPSGTGPTPSTRRRDRTLRFPIIMPTERTVGQTPGADDRQTFEIWMKKIGLKNPSNELSAIGQKITALQNFIDNPQEGSISHTLSHLMFLQTFEYMVTEFNASVAGFLWEPFLAAMFGGESRQVATSEGDITDVKLQIKVGGKLQSVSLKLLSPNTLVGGSFRDLVNHFRENPDQPMVYLVIRKHSKDEVDNALMTFYEFDITQENFFDYIGHPKMKIQTKPMNIVYDPEEDEIKERMKGSRPPKFFKLNREDFIAWHQKRVSDFPPEGWEIKRGYYVNKEKIGSTTRGISPGDTVTLKLKSAKSLATPAGAGADRYENSVKLWGDDEEYAQWFQLWEELEGGPEFWKAVMGENDLGPDGKPAPGIRGKKEQFEINPGYLKEGGKAKDLGTLDISPGKLQKVFDDGAKQIGDDLTAMFNAVSNLVDNVGRFFLIDCGDPKAETKTCDENDEKTRSNAGHAAITDTETLKTVVDRRIAHHMEAAGVEDARMTGQHRGGMAHAVPGPKIPEE